MNILGYPTFVKRFDQDIVAPLKFASLDAYFFEMPVSSLSEGCELIAEDAAQELETLILDMIMSGEYPVLIVQTGGYMRLTVTNFPQACTICGSRAINDSSVCLECGWLQKKETKL